MYCPPRPQVFFKDPSGQSASTYPVSDFRLGQDGDPRSLVLIITPVPDDRSIHPGFQAAVRLSGHLPNMPQIAAAVRRPPMLVAFLRRRYRRLEGAFIAQHCPGDAGGLGR